MLNGEGPHQRGKGKAKGRKEYTQTIWALELFALAQKHAAFVNVL